MGAALNPLFLALALLLWSTPAISAQFPAHVVNVSDGDTVTVRLGDGATERVRLSGIDAPEKIQPFGVESRRNLLALAGDRDVVVIWHKRDRYKRIVGKVMAAGRDVCLEQVAAGMAWHYVKYQAEQEPADREAYATAETAAKQETVGLWIDPDPTPPWEFRKERRRAK